MYKNVKRLNNELAAVQSKKNDKWGCINNKFQEIIPCLYDHIMSDSLFIYCGNDGVDFKDNVDPFSGNILYAKWGCFDINGKCIIPVEYDRITILNEYISAGKGHGLIRGQDGFRKGFDGKWALFSKDGHMILNDYNEIEIQEGFFIVRKNVRYKTYKEEYDWVDFTATGGYYCIYNTEGKILIDNIKEIGRIDDYAIISNEHTNFDYNSTDLEAEKWDAMTDGMYGDYPGGDIDYDKFGF